MPEAEVRWEGPAERLDRVVAETQLARSRSRAAELIAEGRVLLNGKPATKAGLKVSSGAMLSVVGDDRYVSRAAEKLVAGLDVFDFEAAGRLALDLGASTGGFTQVLLEQGAACVLAIDVGHNQMVDSIRLDERVRAVEGCNARELTRASLADSTGIQAAPDLVVADLSFISLTLIFPAIDRCAADDADLVLLVKPQFEVGRVRDGVVTDPAQRAEAMRTVLQSAAEHRFACRGLQLSPVIGGTGNREYLVHFTRGDQPDPTQWEQRIVELSQLPTVTPTGRPKE